MPVYGNVTLERIAELQELVLSSQQVLFQEKIPNYYAYDAGTEQDAGLRQPEVVVFPNSAQEVARILRWANEWLIPVTPRGGGSGLAGGAVPLYGGIVLDFQRMNRILAIDPVAKYMVVEPGVRTIDIQQTAQQQGLLYAGDPCSNDDCVIAGNVATNAGGNRAVKYGVTSDQVYELEVVTPQGEIVNLGGRLKKNATGYGLVKLIAGSEGTLGIITKITLKLQKLAPLLPTFLAVLPSLSAAVDLVGELLEVDGLNPISLEIMDQETLLALERYRQEKFFHDQIGDCLLIQLEAQSQADLEQQREVLQKLGKQYQTLTLEVVDGEQIWQARRQWGKAINVDQPVGVTEDLVVPVDEIADFIQALKTTVVQFGLDFRLAGHAGDGNMHVHILPGLVELAEWDQTLQRFREKLYALVYTLGGRLSGEHGIGVKRKEFFHQVASPGELELMRSVKKAFDPNLILNPGKIFDMA